MRKTLLYGQYNNITDLDFRDFSKFGKLEELLVDAKYSGEKIDALYTRGIRVIYEIGNKFKDQNLNLEQTNLTVKSVEIIDASTLVTLLTMEEVFMGFDENGKMITLYSTRG